MVFTCRMNGQQENVRPGRVQCIDSGNVCSLTQASCLQNHSNLQSVYGTRRAFPEERGRKREQCTMPCRILKVRDSKLERACLCNDAADKLVWLQQLSRQHAMAHLVNEEVSHFNGLRLPHHAHHMCRVFTVPPSLEQHLLQHHVSVEKGASAPCNTATW